jgi:hypothetical protein
MGPTNGPALVTGLQKAGNGPYMLRRVAAGP